MQLRGWYSKDDVVAEWKDMKGHMCLVVHCYVSGPNNFFVDLAAEFRYHIFSKELPLVLKAVLYGDSAFFKEHPELMEAVVQVYFHSRSPKYNCIECWGPLKDAAQVPSSAFDVHLIKLDHFCIHSSLFSLFFYPYFQKGDQIRGLLGANEQDSIEQQKLQSPKSFFQELFTSLF
ncbi:hypothetical protein Cgig2_005964 [Carnegiea gigantea]|uniref:Staygreen protein domain-containing protein n=1 Tax=Carnegiea gigantea TaxID=171969 RepID=A0A9Q1KJL2_9CARY|nr:hypothetical protein Cgig2_005964 [Carnegiea gigantea]